MNFCDNISLKKKCFLYKNNFLYIFLASTQIKGSNIYGSQYLLDQNLQDQTEKRSMVCGSTVFRRALRDCQVSKFCCILCISNRVGASPCREKSLSQQSRPLCCTSGI